VLIPAHTLLRRLRRPRDPSGEAAEVRARMRAEPRWGGGVSGEERRLAREVRAVKLELSAALAGVRSCGTCARGFPPPNGYWDGGNCCGGNTLSIFDDDEIAGLRLGGTAPRRLVAPEGPQAGCAFRGATGCSLAAADRPALCVRYVCNDLARELHGRGELERIEQLRDRLGAAYQAFVAAREERRVAAALAG
jgi:hypothetical protein